MSTHAPVLTTASSDPSLSPECPNPKCNLSVYLGVKAEGRPPVPEAGVTVVNDNTHAALEGKTTDQTGKADYNGVPVDSYTATVTLTATQMKKYAWSGNDGATASESKSGTADRVTLYPFEVILLARPQIKVLLKEDEKPDTPLGAVKVKLSPDIAFTDTADNVGIAELAADARGLRANSYDVTFTFPSKNLELLDGRQINVTEGSTDTFPFHVRKCWVEFVVSDQFDIFLEAADYVLTYPDSAGQGPESGSLTAGDNGKVHKEVPPGEYKFDLKWICQPEWEEDSAEIDKAIKLYVQASGFAAGDITFEIFDACAPTGDALDTVTAATLADMTAEADWTPAEAKLDKVTSGEVLFVAKAGKQTATSGPIPIQAKRVFNVTGPDDAPLETELVLHFSNGRSITARSTGGKAEPLVPLGQKLVSIELTGQTGVYPSFQLPGATAQTCFIPKVT